MTSQAVCQLLGKQDVSPDIAEDIWDIYQGSFPPSERKSRDDLIKLLAHPNYTNFVVADRDRVIAFAIVYAPRSKEFALLEYMATQERHRGHGHGGKLFQYICQSLANRFIIIELESPDEQSIDQCQRQRRMNFYKRHGCREIVGLDYILPLETPHTPPKMRLLIWSSSPLPTMSRARIKNSISDIYVKVYGQAKGDPRLGEMFDRGSDPFELELGGPS